MSQAITGRCMCSSVRYELGEGIRFCLFCQCRDCQRITGTGHAALFGAMRKSTAVSGALSSFEYQAESGATMQSLTCAECGNPIAKLSSRYPELYFFHAATLDRPELFTPKRAVWSGSSQPWDALPPALAVEE